MSARSFQRGLTAEGASCRRLSDEMRRERAIAALPGGVGALSSVAAGLGYTAQSSLSRAVRRWTGVPPTTFAGGVAAQPDKV
jgi:AraC-like DNA-binding protein